LVAQRGAAGGRRERPGGAARRGCARECWDFFRGDTVKGRARQPSPRIEVLRPALPGDKNGGRNPPAPASEARQGPTPRWPRSPVADLYRAHAQTVARWASRLGGPAIDVEDVVQEVFLVVQRRLDGFRGDAHVKTWLYRITANVVRWRRRKDK